MIIRSRSGKTESVEVMAKRGACQTALSLAASWADFSIMNKTQFYLLNALALLFLLLTGVRFLLIKDLEAKRANLVQIQAVVSQGQQSEQALRKIILRLVQASQREPDLKDLLKQFNVKISSNPAAQPAAAVSSPATPAAPKAKP